MLFKINNPRISYKTLKITNQDEFQSACGYIQLSIDPV